VIFYSKNSRYSANAVVAALESWVKDAEVYMVRWDAEDILTFLRRLEEKGRRILAGFSFNTFEVPEVMHLVKAVREVTRNAVLVAGGPHATGDPVGTLLKLGFDIVVHGEGEETVVELYESYASGGDPCVCGTACRDGDRVLLKKRARRVNLDDFPPFPYWRRRFNPIEIMRGCASACYFCEVTYAFGMPRYRSIDSVLHYSKIKLERGLKDLRFISPNSLGYCSRDGIKPATECMEELLSKLRRLADGYGGRIFFGTFPSEVRPDSVTEEAVDVLRKYADNRRVIVGAQSGSNRILRAIHRGHTVEDVINAVEVLRSRGFGVDVDVIFGLPGEGPDDVEETLKMVEALVERGARIHAHTFIPLPGTPFDAAPPGRIDPEVRKRLSKILGRGAVYGDWIEQEKLAELVDKMRREGIVHTLAEQSKRMRVASC